MGVGAGVLVVGLAIASCWFIRRKRRQPGLRSKKIFEIGESSIPAVEAADNSSGVMQGEKGGQNNVVFELDGGVKGVELPVSNEAGEVHGESAVKRWPGMFR